MNKAEKVKQWALSMVGTGYVYGATGWICTPKRREQQAKQYPQYAGAILGVCQKWDGVVCHDCAQFTRKAMEQAGISLPSGATSQWKGDVWAQKGTIDSLPRDKVCLLYKESGGRMQHTLISLGDGQVVDARGSSKGVVLSRLGEYKATHWGIPRGLYEEQEEKPMDKARDTIRKGAKGPTVIELQGLLLRCGYQLPRFGADGSFGEETRQAVMAFQRDKGLTVDGVCGPKTWAALWAVVSGPEQGSVGGDLENGGVEESPKDLYTVTIRALTQKEAAALIAKYGGRMEKERGESNAEP